MSYFSEGKAMKTTRISSKGQVVLPKSLRESQKWESGTELAVEAMDGGVFLRTLQPFPGTTIDCVFGCLNYEGKPKSVAEMHGAIAKETRRRRGRGRY
jgi:AbrB family looped-hinge helix DNA binding protein